MCVCVCVCVCVCALIFDCMHMCDCVYIIEKSLLRGVYVFSPDVYLHNLYFIM